MEAWTRILVLSIGGVLGVNARYWLGVLMDRWALAHWATFTINISGSFAIGFLSMLLIRWLPNPHIRLLILTGFLGGYTTFSTLAFEAATLWERGDKGLALANIGGSLVVGLVAALLGIALARDIVLPTWERASATERKALSRLLIPPSKDGRLPEADAGSPDLELPLSAEALAGDLGQERGESGKSS